MSKAHKARKVRYEVGDTVFLKHGPYAEQFKGMEWEITSIQRNPNKSHDSLDCKLLAKLGDCLNGFLMSTDVCRVKR